MIAPNRSSVRVWLYRRPTDMRKSYNGLSALAKHVLNEDPLCGAVFVFINRRRDPTTFNISSWLRGGGVSLASAAR
jgi:transposase